MSSAPLETERLKNLRQLMKKYNTEAVLITSPANRRYYSGFEATDTQINESSGALLITSRGQWLLTDARYTEVAEEEARLFKILTYARGLAIELASLGALKKITCLVFEADFLSVWQKTLLELALPNLKLLPVPFNLDAPRAVKSPHEISLIKKALVITEKAISNLWLKMEPGMTEREAAFFLENEFRRLGADGPSFETIVASGPNGSKPHAVPGLKKIKAGETVVIDCGAQYKGYAADITRTKIIGQAKKWQTEIYKIVREAQLLAIKSIKPGIKASDVDRVARDHIAKHGYGPFFNHSLGHGVGLNIHEAPTLSPRNEQPLQVGEVITVEPGIYLPGRGGVRLEELILVTEKGCRLLNRNQDFYDF